MTAPVIEVALSPILSERMPAKKERKKVEPIAKEPTNAKIIRCFFHYSSESISIPHLKAASSSPDSSKSAFSLTKSIPKVLIMLKTIPFTRKEQIMMNQAWKKMITTLYLHIMFVTLQPPSGGSTSPTIFMKI